MKIINIRGIGNVNFERGKRKVCQDESVKCKRNHSDPWLKDSPISTSVMPESDPTCGNSCSGMRTKPNKNW